MVVHSTPLVRLVAHTQDPYAIAVASARTCYASEFVLVGQLGPNGVAARTTLAELLPAEEATLDGLSQPSVGEHERQEVLDRLRDEYPEHAAHLDAFQNALEARLRGDGRIAASIWEAGHHTPFQHPTFTFQLAGVSRNVVESFFHQHTFFNSEQQSQRYVEMDQPRVVAPHGLSRDAQEVFDQAVVGAWQAYHELRDSLIEANIRTMTAIGKIKGQSEGKIREEAEKKAQEMARYVLPVAATTQLYHTISGVVLLRYVRMCEAQETSAEAREIVHEMVQQVEAMDPEWARQIQEQPHEAETLLDRKLAGHAPLEPVASIAELVNATPDAEAIVVEAMRNVTGTELPAGELLETVLSPATNSLWNDTLNTWDHSPLLRALRHVHLTYRKTISLTAYAQDQRHRMTPGTRPQLHRLITPQPQVVVPDVFDQVPEARARYDAIIATLWDAMHKLGDLGYGPEVQSYLLPNATQQTYLQSGDLLSWIHKWRLRLCFNAQKEIFDASIQELRAAQAVMPSLTQFLGPPCTFISAALPADAQDDPKQCCPEGPRWCGVKVWKNFDAEKGKPKRPF